MNSATPHQPSAGIRLSLVLDNYDVSEFAAHCLAGSAGPGYVVTPNADHLIRFAEDADFRGLYADARYVLLDSRFLAHLTRMTSGEAFKVCPGSDLTAALLTAVRGSDSPILLIGSTDEQAETLRRDYSLLRLIHYNPPMGFIAKEEEVGRCLEFISAAGTTRFCFLALGSPQQELLARLIAKERYPVGLIFCVGASINFLTGVEQRAPGWMQRAGLEWLYRLSRDPRRLAYRYLVRGPRVFAYLRKIDLVRRERP